MFVSHRVCGGMSAVLHGRSLARAVRASGALLANQMGEGGSAQDTGIGGRDAEREGAQPFGIHGIAPGRVVREPYR
jgi:hypothetical protein